MYFDSVTSLDELKAAYKRLALKNHPDMGGDLRTMQAINAEYDSMFAILKAKHNAQAKQDGTTRATTETPEEYRQVVEAIINLDGIEVELCGCWLWVSGDTYTHKDALKAAGFRWSRTKKMWYWHHAEDGQRWSRGCKSMEEIRNTYGSEKLGYAKHNSLVA